MTKNRRRDRAINDIAQYLGIPHAFAALAERDVPHADLLPGFVADAG